MFHGLLVKFAVQEWMNGLELVVAAGHHTGQRPETAVGETKACTITPRSAELTGKRHVFRVVRAQARRHRDS